MLRHIAFRTLSGAAVRVLLELWSRHNGRNNGDLWLAYRDAHSLLKMNKAATARAFSELQTRGFIVRTSRGSRAKHVAPRWRLTMLANDEAPPTNEWASWLA